MSPFRETEVLLEVRVVFRRLQGKLPHCEGPYRGAMGPEPQGSLEELRARKQILLTVLVIFQAGPCSTGPLEEISTQPLP